MTVLTDLKQKGYYQVILSRDQRYDGLFYFAVKTTGIYCRPSCPAPRPLEENVTYYKSVEEARAQGYRACKRCHPDRLKDSHARTILETMYDTAATGQNVHELAQKFDMSDRHLRRIVQAKTGTSPLQLRQVQRLNTAHLLLTNTKLPIVDVAFSADFSSLRQFNFAFKKAFSLTPSEIRKQNVDKVSGPIRLNLKLRYKPPIAWQPLINGLKAHTVPYIDFFDRETNTLTRLVKEKTAIAKVTISLNDYKDHVRVALETTDIAIVDKIVTRIRRLMDLDHDPAKINIVLARDPLLAPMVTARPGLRILGSFHPFELLALTIIGQQISVTAARTFAGRLVKQYGQMHQGMYLFPTVKAILGADPQLMYEQTKLNHKKIASLRAVAQQVNSGMDLEDETRRVEVLAALLAVKGIGPWSIEYFGLRGFGDPNAFPADDLLIKRRLGTNSTKETIAIAEKWQPFRGYGAMHIWSEGAYA